MMRQMLILHFCYGFNLPSGPEQYYMHSTSVLIGVVYFLTSFLPYYRLGSILC